MKLSAKNILFPRLVSIFCLLFVFMSSAMPGTLHSERCDEVTLGEARNLYELGQFQQVFDLLSPCLKEGFTSQQRVEALRLMAFSYLAIDSLDAAYDQTMQILQINPAYQPSLFDPPGFIEQVRQIRLAGETIQVTSVSKKAENIDEVPATIAVITRRQIRERGYQDLVELLKDLPGFDLSMFYASQYANVYQRGFRQGNTEKTLLLIDGIEENDLWTNWAYIDRQYPITNIEQVEIIYGPASTMYGPNAFAGVINVITRSAADAIPEGSNIGISANTGYGTYHTRYMDMSVAGQRRSISFNLSARMFYSDEMDLSSQHYFDYDPAVYDDVDYAGLLNVDAGAAQYLADNNLPFEHPYYLLSNDGNSLFLTEMGIDVARNLDKSGYDQIVNGNKVGFTNKSEYGLINGRIHIGSFSFGLQTWQYSRGSTTQYTDTYVPGSENGFVWVPQQSYFFTQYENQLSDNLYISNLTTYRIHALTDNSRFVFVSNYARGNLGLGDLVEDKEPFWTTLYAHSISKQLRSEFKTIYSPTEKLDIVSGLELRNSTLQGGYLFSQTPNPQDSAVILPSPPGGNSFNVWDVGLYTQGTFQAHRDLRLTLGLRYDYNRVRATGGFGSEISPRFAAVYTPGRLIFKAIYARGIMNVSNWTKYSSAGNRIPNPTLGTENIQTLELNAGYRPDAALYADLNIYRQYIDDVVGIGPVPGLPGFTHNDNIGKFVINGIQANLHYNIASLSTWFNYTYCDPRQTFAETGKVDNRVGDIARHQFNIGANRLFFDQLNINLRGNFSGKRKVGPGTTVPLNTSTFPAVFIMNGAATYSNPKLRGIEIQLVCNNILNSKYYHPGTKAADGIDSPTEILQRDRHFLLQVSYNL